MTDTEAYAAARKRAEAKYHFFVHLAIYSMVMLLLVAINLITSSGYLWFVWPLLGWGIAIVIHGVSAFAMLNRSNFIDQLTERELRASKH